MWQEWPTTLAFLAGRVQTPDVRHTVAGRGGWPPLWRQAIIRSWTVGPWVEQPFRGFELPAKASGRSLGS